MTCEAFSILAHILLNSYVPGLPVRSAMKLPCITVKTLDAPVWVLWWGRV